MTAPRPAQRPPSDLPAGMSMRDLLASCAAADAVSRPPRPPQPLRGAPESTGERREAAWRITTADPGRRRGGTAASATGAA
ncbi:hypothetical protein [Streptomyces sp. NPDC096012]|uniref:hypothetical protein n=1 Tax=Streptomyces sp. NPDC096012 TaxID=3155684 RepID=UPI00336A6896